MSYHTYQLPAPLVASIIEAMPARLKRRAEKLSTEHHDWVVTDQPLSVTIGENTVQFDGTQLTCSCLLSPKCAHCGAVALVADIAADSVAPSSAEPVDTSENSAAAAATRRSLPPQEAINQAVALTTDVLTDIVEHGLLGQDPLGYARLVAALHQARLVPLPRLERVLTSLVTMSAQYRSGSDSARTVRRQAVGAAVGEALLTNYLLQRDPTDPDAIGTARRAYAELTPGRDDGVFTPIYAEPVVTGSGFAGAVVTLVDSKGKLFSVGQTPPGTVDDVQRVWEGPVRLGDIHTSLRNFSQHKVTVSGGSASADGRIGSGKNVRAALGKEVELEELLSLAQVQSVDGQISHADLLSVTINDQRYFFSQAARMCGVAGLVAKLLDAGTATIILREHTIMAVWLAGKRYLPGLDARSSLITVISASGTLGTPEISPKQIIGAWLERAAIGGRQAVVHRAMASDINQLETASAPTAAQLLTRLRQDYSPQAVTSLAVYLR
jgi:hypothetical protein